MVRQHTFSPIAPGSRFCINCQHAEDDYTVHPRDEWGFLRERAASYRIERATPANNSRFVVSFFGIEASYRSDYQKQADDVFLSLVERGYQPTMTKV